MSHYVVLGTWDTKRKELEFLCDEITKRGHTPVRIDLPLEERRSRRDTVVDHSISTGKKELSKVVARVRTEAIINVDLSINDPAFGLLASEKLAALMGTPWKT